MARIALQQPVSTGRSLAPVGALCWDDGKPPVPFVRRPHAPPDRLLFLVLVAMGLYRPQGLPRRRRDPWCAGEPQAGGAGRTVLRDRRAAAGQTPSGAAALSHDGAA